MAHNSCSLWERVSGIIPRDTELFVLQTLQAKETNFTIRPPNSMHLNIQAVASHCLWLQMWLYQTSNHGCVQSLQRLFGLVQQLRCCRCYSIACVSGLLGASVSSLIHPNHFTFCWETQGRGNRTPGNLWCVDPAGHPTPQSPSHNQCACAWLLLCLSQGER